MAPAKKNAAVAEAPTSNGNSAAASAAINAVDDFVKKAQANAAARTYTHEVAAVKIFESLQFFNRVGLDSQQAVELAKASVELELMHTRYMIQANRILNEGGGLTREQLDAEAA